MNELNVTAFWARLKELCKTHKITLEKLCAEIGTPKQNMINKKFRKTFPTLDELVKISSFFDTSIDYLVLGKSDNPLQKRIDELELHLKLIADIASRH